MAESGHSLLKNLNIRPANEEDALKISQLYKQVWDDYREQFPEELVVSRQPNEKKVKLWLEKDRYFVATIDQLIVGVVGASLQHGTCQLTHMVVHKDYRGEGIGSALSNHVITYARNNKNIMKVWLDTVPILNEAKQLYIKLGFEKCGHFRKHFWGMDVELFELVFTE